CGLIARTVDCCETLICLSTATQRQVEAHRKPQEYIKGTGGLHTARPPRARNGEPKSHTGSDMAPWEASPFIKLLGMKIIARSPERSESQLFIREELCNRRGVIHGGALMGWADTMGG